MRFVLAIVALLATVAPASATGGARTYPIQVERVIDGDSVVALFDIGFDLSLRRTVRLLCVDTPEVYGASREAGLRAKAEAANWIAENAPLSAALPPDSVDKYGRTLAVILPEISLGTASSLNRHLIDTGNAVEYLCPVGTVY